MDSSGCKNCAISERAHPCWKHAGFSSECRSVKSKWAPTKCRQCISAVANIFRGTSEDRQATLAAYKGFLLGLRQFVNRVSRFKSNVLCFSNIPGSMFSVR